MGNTLSVSLWPGTAWQHTGMSKSQHLEFALAPGLLIAAGHLVVARSEPKQRLHCVAVQIVVQPDDEVDEVDFKPSRERGTCTDTHEWCYVSSCDASAA